MKSLIASILVLGLVGFVVGVGTQAADVDVTVTPQIVSATVGDGDVDYGTLAAGDSAHTNTAATPSGTALETQTITSTSNVSTDIVLRSSDAAKTGELGVTNWALGGTAGTDIFVHSYDIDATGTPSWNAFPDDGTFDNTNTAPVVTLVNNGNTATLDLKIDMPDTITETSVHSIDITVVATATN